MHQSVFALELVTAAFIPTVAFFAGKVAEQHVLNIIIFSKSDITPPIFHYSLKPEGRKSQAAMLVVVAQIIFVKTLLLVMKNSGQGLTPFDLCVL